MRIGAVAVVLLAAAACGGGGGSGSELRGASAATTNEAICRLVDRLAESAEPLVEVGAADPEQFASALDAAVLDFTSTVDALIDVAPDDAVADLEELRGLVEQHRFQEAIEARASIDEYARRICDEPVSGA